MRPNSMCPATGCRRWKCSPPWTTSWPRPWPAAASWSAPASLSMSPAWKSKLRRPTACTSASRRLRPDRIFTPSAFRRETRTRSTGRVTFLRRCRLCSSALRAQAVAETTTNLITLEAQTAFLRWQEASSQIREAREAADTGDKMAEDISKDFTAGLKVKIDDVINGRVLASQARSQYNEYLYRQILALADLERITAGAFSARLVDAAASQATPAKTR
ncbi:MAG: TolC family protein [Planctomycetota bacterium]|nr:MAG: TolC family protein [Planctomycetota bacterium]